MPVITAVLAIGTLAARPAASASNTGFLYCASDLNGGTLFQSNGASWVQIAAAVTQTADGVGAVANAGSAPSLQVGLDAALPAAGTAGRLYVARDTGNLYEDTGSAWIVVATVQWANLSGKPATFAPSAHEASHLSGGSDAIAREGLLPQVASSVESLATDPASPADGRTWLNTALGAIKARIAGATEILNDWNFLRNKPSTFTPATHTHPESDVTSLATDLAARVQLSPGSQQTGAINVSGEVQGSDFKPGGVTGATAAARYHAATATGHPTTGTWAVGDIVPDQTGTFWFCTVAGTPGTWVQVGGTGGGAGSSTLAGDTDVAISSPVDGQVLGYNSALSKWVNQNQAGVAATTSTAQLGANITLTTANTWYDILSLTLPPGTWLLIGTAHGWPSVGDFFSVRLWDGTTTITSAGQNSNANWDFSESVSAIVSPTSTTTYRLSASCVNGGTVVHTQAQYDPVGAATYLQAIQLSGNPVGQTAPAVRCYNSANISITTGTWTTLTFDTNVTDQGSSAAQHSTSSNTSRLVCQQSGVYIISANVAFSGNSTGARALAIVKNGTTTLASELFAPPQDGNWAELSVTTPPVFLAVGDYVEAQAAQWSGVALNVMANGSWTPAFGMARIDSGPGAVQPNTKVQLDYEPNTDIISGLSLIANTWVDLTSNQTFMVDDANSVIELIGNGMIMAGNMTTGMHVAVRAVIDSTGTPITKFLSASPFISSGPGSNNYQNILQGIGSVTVTGLSAGSHTVKLQAYSADNACTAYCRPSTYPNVEFLAIRVLERKQSSSPVSTAPAPAVRCYNSATQSIPNGTYTAITFDTNRYDQGVSTPQHNTSSNTSRLTCQQSGVYIIGGCILFAANASGAQRIAALRLNGATRIAESDYAPEGSNPVEVTVSTTYQLNVGDYVELMAYQSSGSALNSSVDGNAAPEFWMARVDTGSTGVLNVTTQNANYSIPSVCSLTIVTASSKTMTLPTAAGVAGQSCVVKNNASSTGTTVSTVSSQTIDGASTYSLVNANASATFVSDGTNWQVV